MTDGSFECDERHLSRALARPRALPGWSVFKAVDEDGVVVYCKTDRLRRNPVRDHLQPARAHLDSRRYVERCGNDGRAGCDPHGAVVMSPGIEHMSGGVVGQPNQRIVGWRLKFIAECLSL